MKTLKTLRDEASIKMVMWNDIAFDEKALKDRNKSKSEALILANYFEGKFDAFNQAIRMTGE